MNRLNLRRAKCLRIIGYYGQIQQEKPLSAQLAPPYCICPCQLFPLATKNGLFEK